MRVSSGDGFGPVGPTPGGTPPFAVAGPSQVKLDGSRLGSGSFTVSNVTGRPVRARVFVQPGAGADPSWFEVTGGPERALPVAGTATVDVAVRVPEKAPAGSFTFQLGAALEEAPDQVVSGPTVSFEVPPIRRKPFPWWIVIVAAVALLVLVGGGLLIWNLTRPDPQPSPTASDPPVHLEDRVFVDVNQVFITGSYLDLDEGILSTTFSDEGEDVYFYPGGGSGEVGVVGQGSPRLAVVSEPSHTACRSATDYDDLNAQNIVLLPDRTTYVCVQVTDQSRLSLMSIGPAEGGLLPVSFVTWVRG